MQSRWIESDKSEVDEDELYLALYPYLGDDDMKGYFYIGKTGPSVEMVFGFDEYNCSTNPYYVMFRDWSN